MAVVDDMGGSKTGGGGEGVLPLTLFDKRSSGKQAMLLIEELGVVEPFEEGTCKINSSQK